MRVKFLDMQDDANPLNGKWIDNPEELETVFDKLWHREPFGFKLDGENGAMFDVCIANTFGSVQCTTSDDTYLSAVKPGSIPFVIADNSSPHTFAFLADEESGLESPEFLVARTATPIPTRYILPYDLVREIAVHFLRTGERSPDVWWEQI
jgi:hypothetical protein